MIKQGESKQTMWETWFVISVILCGVMIFTGTLEYSKLVFPNWPYFAVIVIANLVYCLKVGTLSPKED
jgi:uncharacterized membrane protein